MQGFVIVPLDEMVIQLGEDRVKEILSSFYCPMNRDVNNFLKSKSIEFAKQGLAKTHLVFAQHKGVLRLVAYFSLSNKYFSVSQKSNLTKTMKRRIGKFAQYYHDTKAYIISAPLIAQLGKNFDDGLNKLITGDELLKLACDKVKEAQVAIGGKIVYLECEDKQKLIDFYESNGFVCFDKRTLDHDEKDDLCGNYLLQMMRYMKD